MSQSIATPVQTRPRRSWALCATLSAGHLLKHFYQNAFFILVPEIKASLGLSDVGTGAIQAIRSITSGVVNLPAGMVTDTWRNRLNVILAVSLASLAIGYLIIGITPNYVLILIAVAISGSGTAMWHAPAFGTLAAEYPERRATAMSFHRMGGSIGDTVAPTVIGVLLGGGSLWFLEFSGFTYREVALFLVVPALLGAALVAYGYRNLYAVGSAVGNVRSYFAAAVPLLANPTVISMILLSSAHSFAHGGLNLFLVLYMREDLGFSETRAGLYFSMLTFMGILSTAPLAFLSDKWGRRPVIVLGMASISVLILAMIPFGTGLSLAAIVLALGVFLYSINPVMLAAAIDAAESGTEGTGIALMFTGPAIVGAVAPVVAGLIRESFAMQGVFLFQGVLVGVVAMAALFVPMKKAAERPA